MKKLHDKRELNLRPNESRMHDYKNICGINMKILMEHLIEESREYRKFRCLPDIC